MKALITGSNGLLGSAIKNKIGNDHLLHSRAIADLTKINEVDNLFEWGDKLGCDTVIHCAAKVGGVQANMNENQKFFLYNIVIDTNVMTNAFKHKYKNVVTILSTCVFPEHANYPLTVDQIDSSAPHQSNHGYSYAKRMLYYSTQIFRHMTGQNWISIIPTNLFGPHDQFSLENGHIVPALIRKAYYAKQNNTDFIVWGDGSPLRQFVFSEDMADIVLWAKNNWEKDVPLIAVNEKEYSIKEVAYLIADNFEIAYDRIKFDTTKPSGIFRKPAKSDIKYWNFTPLDVALEKTIEWFKNNVDTVRT